MTETATPEASPAAPTMSVEDLGQLAELLAKQRAEKEKKDAALFTVRGSGLAALVDFRRSNNAEFAAAVRTALSDQMGAHRAANYADVYPLALLGKYDPHVRNELDEAFYVTAEDEVCGPFVRLLDEFRALRADQVRAQIERGVIEYEDVRHVFESGRHVYGYTGGQLVAGIVIDVERKVTFRADYQEVLIRVFHNHTGYVEDGKARLFVMSYEGHRSFDDLEVKLLDEPTRERLTERGRKFREFTVGASYVQYAGQVTQASWLGDKNYRGDGRVMVDSASMSQMAADVWRSEVYNSSIVNEDSRNNQANKRHAEVAEAELWRTYPFVFGFGFMPKQWGRIAVDGLAPIDWRDDAFDKLVLPDEDKELVRALVEQGSDSFQDLIDGKGGGTIFLLHGPPGEGKTLTAEAIAEILHRPLYSVSVGELGTDPDSLETALRQVLDLATVWNAVVLIDEADIFLEERDENDIVRNAMVGVFLRLLEYHQGVLFLTTNRVKNIDTAFYSRISIALRYKGGDHAKRVRIWSNLLRAAKLEGLDVHALADHELNGRQIKNVIRQSQTLARARGAELNEAVIGRVVKLTTRFTEQMRESRGG